MKDFIGSTDSRCGGTGHFVDVVSLIHESEASLIANFVTVLASLIGSLLDGTTLHGILDTIN